MLIDRQLAYMVAQDYSFLGFASGVACCTELPAAGADQPSGDLSEAPE